jgi:hypothetical protein
MEWDLHYAKDEELLLEQQRVSGREVPALKNKPVLYEDLLPIWDAFLQLNASRQGGFGPAPILNSEILAWLDIVGYTDAEVRREFYELIRRVDSAWMHHYAEQQEAEKESKSKDKGKGKGTDSPPNQRMKELGRT